MAFIRRAIFFKKRNEYHFIIGSSNLTMDALTRNMEWNTRIVSMPHGEMINDVLSEFNKLWNATDITRPYEDIREDYQRKYSGKTAF